MENLAPWAMLADTTNLFTWVASPACDSLSLVLTDPSGAETTLTPLTTDNGTTWTLSVQSADLPGSKLGRWRRNVIETRGSQVKDNYSDVWLLDTSYSGYGDLSGVLALLGRLVPALTSASTPPLSEVVQQMRVESDRLNVKLTAAGYVIPVTETAPADFLGHAIELAVAAVVFRTLAAGRDPALMARAADYKADADSDIRGVLDGSLVFKGLARDSETEVARTPVAGAEESAFPTDLASNIGRQFGGGFVGGSGGY